MSFKGSPDPRSKRSNPVDDKIGKKIQDRQHTSVEENKELLDSARREEW
jgi:hypothetical protein